MVVALIFLGVHSVGALKVPVVTRRAALGGAIAGLVPHSVSAAGLGGPVNNPLSNDFSGYKARDYGNGANTAPGSVAKSKVTECAEDERLAPDGFGGKKCVPKVKPVAQRVVDTVVGGDAPASPPPAAKKAAPPPRKSVGERTSSSASAPLTFDELLANSIKQKEEFNGRELTPEEKEMMKAKLKALMQ